MPVTEKSRQILLWSVLILILLIPVKLLAYADELVVDAGSSRVSLDPYTSILLDPEHKLKINDLPDLSAETFLPLSEVGNSLGFSDAVIWLHFRIKTLPDAPVSMLLSLDAPLLDKLSLFSPGKGGEFNEQSSGDKIPFSKRQFEHRNPVFYITLPEQQSKDFYLRLESKGPIQIPMTLWSHDSFIGHLDKSQLLFGAYYGFMVVLILASLYAFILLKEQVFFRYSVYLAAFLLFQMSINGISFQFLWGELPQIASQINSSLVGMVVMAALWFSSDFLRIKKYSPGSYRLFQILKVFTGVCTLLIWTELFQLATKLVVYCGIALVPVFTLAAFQVLRQGYKPARYFSLAWAALMLGVFAAGLRFAGILPANFFTLYAMQISSTLEIMILMLALMDRFSLLQEAKIMAERQARNAIFRLNHDLEALVSKRTEALKSINLKLQKLATQDSLTGLLNHSTSIQQVERALDGAHRYNYALAIMMVDIDYFKSLNDSYGHQAGDEILCAISRVMRANLRTTDTCGRYGGEEFILVLTHTEIAEVRVLGERLKEAISHVKSERAPGAKVTASLGIVMCYPNQCNSYTVDTLITAADKALYQAKNTGRNRICFAPMLQLNSS